MRTAAAQLRPAWLDEAATTERTLTALEDAARQDVDLVAFPETWLAGYPSWLDRTDSALRPRAAEGGLRVVPRRCRGGRRRRGPVGRGGRARPRRLHYLGMAERGSGDARGTVFATLLAVDPRRGVVSHHRKLVPTYEERLVRGPGDGYGLRVHQVGDLRVGA